MIKFEDKVEETYIVIWTEKHIIINNSWRLTGPSFDMGFDGAMNGGSYLFGESVSLLDFIKVRTVFDFSFLFSLCVLAGKSRARVFFITRIYSNRSAGSAYRSPSAK